MSNIFHDIATAFVAIFKPERILLALIIIFVAWLTQRLLISVAERLIRNSIRRHHFNSQKDEIQREDTIISILKTGSRGVIWTIAVLMVLGTFNISIGPLLAGAGIAGVALGFGAQSIVKDYLAGFLIIAENQYRVGDVVQVNQGVAGVVQQISMRQTVLRDLQGRVHYVPNGNINIASNLTMDYAQVDLDVRIGYDSDIDMVEKVIGEVGKEIYEDPKWKDIALEPAYMLRVDNFADSAIIIKIVCRTAPIRQWEVKGELLRKLKKAFEKNGIVIPYPQRVIHEHPSPSTKKR